MKQLRNKLLYVTICMCLLSFLFAIVSLVSPIANASASTVDESRFAIGEIETGGIASIRLAEPRGLRFVAEMGQDVYDDLMLDEDGIEKKMGMFIVPYDYLDQDNKYVNGEQDVLGKKYENLITKVDCVFYDSANDSVENKIYQDGDYFYAYGVIGDLYLKNFDRKFVAIAYIAETDSNGTVYKFTDVDESIARSATFVAEASYAGWEDFEDVQDILNEYVIGAHLYEKGLLTEEVSKNGDIRVSTYTFGGTTYKSLSEVLDVANVSFDVTIDKEVITLNSGENAQLVADVEDGGESISIAKNIKWTSSKEDVATVDKNGNVTYVGVGEASITASFMGYSASCEVTCAEDNEKAVAELLASKAINQFDAGLHGTKWYSLGFETSVESGATHGYNWMTKYVATFKGASASNTFGALMKLSAEDLSSVNGGVAVTEDDYVGFYLYTNKSTTETLTVELYSGSFNTANPKATTEAIISGEWTYVEFKLSDIINNGEVQNLCVAIKYTGRTTAETNFNETLYVAGFDIFNKQDAAVAELLASKAINQFDASLHGTKWYSLGFETSVESGATHGYNWMTKYVATFKGASASNTFGALMKLSAEDLSSVNGGVAVTEDDYVGFYLYTNKSTTETLTVELYSGSFNTANPKATTEAIISGEWTYVEFKLSDIINNDGVQNLCVAIKYTGRTTAETNFNETLYVAGFDIYKKS